jgi:hypothetical protein
VLVLGCFVNVVGNRSSSNVLFWLWVVFSMLLEIAVQALLCGSVGLCFQCVWESQFKHCFVVVLGCFCKCCWESQF